MSQIFNYRIALTILILIFCFESKVCVLASETFKNDLGLWTAVNVNVPIKGKFESKFQFSPRWLDNITDFNQFILHALLGYRFNKHISFFQGYAWSTLYIPRFNREQRIYQELTILQKIKKLSFEHRFRFEERFLQGIDGVSLRTRYRLKGIYPLDKNERWSLVLFDELFINLNAGPDGAIDQNRVYAGINHKLTENISIDGGYQLQHRLNDRPTLDRLNHFVFFYLNFYLPPLFENHG